MTSNVRKYLDEYANDAATRQFCAEILDAIIADLEERHRLTRVAWQSSDPNIKRAAETAMAEIRRIQLEIQAERGRLGR